MVTIKKAHLFWAFVMGIMAPAISGMSAYYKTIGEIREDYVKKSELQSKLDKLDRIAEDVAEIKGRLRGR